MTLSRSQRVLIQNQLRAQRRSSFDIPCALHVQFSSSTFCQREQSTLASSVPHRSVSSPASSILYKPKVALLDPARLAWTEESLLGCRSDGSAQNSPVWIALKVAQLGGQGVLAAAISFFTQTRAVDIHSYEHN